MHALSVPSIFSVWICIDIFKSSFSSYSPENLQKDATKISTTLKKTYDAYLYVMGESTNGGGGVSIAGTVCNAQVKQRIGMVMGPQKTDSECTNGCTNSVRMSVLGKVYHIVESIFFYIFTPCSIHDWFAMPFFIVYRQPHMSLDISWAWTMILILKHTQQDWEQDKEYITIGNIKEKVVREDWCLMHHHVVAGPHAAKETCPGT